MGDPIRIAFPATVIPSPLPVQVPISSDASVRYFCAPGSNIYGRQCPFHLGASVHFSCAPVSNFVGRQCPFLLDASVHFSCAPVFISSGRQCSPSGPWRPKTVLEPGAQAVNSGVQKNFRANKNFFRCQFPLPGRQAPKKLDPRVHTV